MRFGPVPLLDAKGAVLAHSVAIKGGRLRKGIVLTAKHLETLAEAGVQKVTVARLEPGDVGEDAAATRLATALKGAGLRASKASTGRVNLYAEAAGILQVDRSAVNALNQVEPMITLATLPQWRRVEAGGLVATVKIISYAVPEVGLKQACKAALGAVRLRQPVFSKVSLVQTMVGEGDGEKGRRALVTRLERLGVELVSHDLVPHEIEACSRGLSRAGGEVLFVLTGSATSDIHDIAPEALRAAGGKVTHFGMPVDPGNLLFIGELNGKPVIGLPGCARSPALNGADWVMERILCGVPIGGEDIAAMGVGGLLKEMPSRPYPREG
ncbi:MAG: molybdopterin-binding protein [Rhodobacteraceae bacterium]|nr:molybdopterin-binding protein [Paracoccaceae bacterium]